MKGINKKLIEIEMFKKGNEYSEDTPYKIEYSKDKSEVYYYDPSCTEGFEPRDFFPIYFNKNDAEYFVKKINNFLKNK